MTKSVGKTDTFVATPREEGEGAPVQAIRPALQQEAARMAAAACPFDPVAGSSIRVGRREGFCGGSEAIRGAG
jgi:hypothetical protein